MAFTTIDDPSAHFQVATWSGNNSNQAITNDGNSDLQPDLVWIKARNESTDHALLDSTRGLTKRLHSNTTDQETSDSSATMSSFDSDGFTMTQYNIANDADDTGVAWQWKANGGTTTAFSESGDNPGGTHQANQTAGFSIVRFVGTGADGTVAHGLGAAPEFIYHKRLDSNSSNNIVYHKHLGTGHNLFMNLNNQRDSDGALYFLNTAPTNTVFSAGGRSQLNENDSPTVAYCWADKQGYSKFGIYRGNGANEGPFIYLGFKPAMLMIKIAIGHTESWHLWDNKRVANGGNPNQAIVSPDTTGQDTGNSTPYNVDFLSNGFKIRDDHDLNNGDGDTYIFAAWAENPFVSSEGIPTTAG